jgi:hypothetical protein
MSDSHAHPHHPKAETAPLHDPTDAWHDHAKDEKPQHEHGEIRNPATVMGVGVALFLAVVVAVVVVDNFYKWYAAQRLAEATVASGPNSPAIEARTFKADTLKAHAAAEGSWMVIPGTPEVPAKAIALIPIKAAAERVSAEYAARAGGKASTAPTTDPAPADAKKDTASK